MKQTAVVKYSCKISYRAMNLRILRTSSPWIVHVWNKRGGTYPLKSCTANELPLLNLFFQENLKSNSQLRSTGMHPWGIQHGAVHLLKALTAICLGWFILWHVWFWLLSIFVTLNYSCWLLWANSFNPHQPPQKNSFKQSTLCRL